MRLSTLRNTVATFIPSFVYFFSDYRSCAKNVEIIQATKWVEEFAIHIGDTYCKNKKEARTEF